MSLNSGLSYIFSNTVFTYALFTGVFLLSMGLGVAVVDKMRLDASRVIKVILLNSLILIAAANPGIPLLFLGNEYLYLALRRDHIDIIYLVYPVAVLLTVVIGFISGLELPLFSKLIESQKIEENTYFGENS